jgi:hypothetical protein
VSLHPLLRVKHLAALQAAVLGATVLAFPHHSLDSRVEI